MTGKKEVSAAGGPKKKLVAAYLRMSTGRQAGSIPNQRLALQSYAQRHRMEIVKEYVDSGKSGVTIKYRKGLQSLILDITGGKVDYAAVLVYDINRWGRFQDVDESAHYEFLCRNAGIEVIYCEEQFKNDGSIFTAVMKTIRRIKAAEDSRELSIKVIAGQSRLAKQGYKQGGPAGYGLRRVSVDRDGSIRRELANGERKSALTDRVLLILGPDHEVAVVRQIYNWYLTGEMLDTAIARELNARGIVSEYGQGRPWTPPIIHNILTCEKYIGTAVYNRTTQRMQTTAVPNPQNVWIRKRNAFPSLIELSIFERVQEIRRNRVRRIPSSDLLEMLRMVFREKGALSTDIINQDPRLPHVVTFANRFQTLSRAYELAGVRPNPRGIRHVATYRRTEQVRSDVFLEVCECIVGCGGTISPGNQRHTLVLNGRYVVSIRVSRAQHYQNKTYYRWEFPLQLPPETDFVIAVQLEPSDTDYKAVYLFPVAAMGCSNVLMREEHPNDYAEYRHDSISALFGI